MATKQYRFFKLFLRIMGTAALFAVTAVVMPYSWMNAIHESLGLGLLPSEPIVGYLARSTSAFYAIFGAALFVVDLLEGLPLYWSLTEGPLNAAFGILILVLAYRTPVK